MMTNIIIGVLIFIVVLLSVLLLRQQKQIGRVEELEKTNQEQRWLRQLKMMI